MDITKYKARGDDYNFVSLRGGKYKLDLNVILGDNITNINKELMQYETFIFLIHC